MNKELFVSSTPHETKVGIVEDDQLAEIYLERENEYTLAGSIYKGRVTRVLPGMQSAFVDIGLERDAFLYVSDFMDLEQQDEDLDEAIPANRPVVEARPRRAAEPAVPGSEGEPAGAEEMESAGKEGSDTEAAPSTPSECAGCSRHFAGAGMARTAAPSRTRRRTGRAGRSRPGSF